LGPVILVGQRGMALPTAEFSAAYLKKDPKRERELSFFTLGPRNNTEMYGFRA
jgi:hypothetical protein